MVSSADQKRAGKGGGMKRGKPKAPDVQLQVEVMDLNGAARFLDLDRTSIYRLMRTDKLPGHRLGKKGRLRFIRAELIEWLKNFESKPMKRRGRP